MSKLAGSLLPLLLLTCMGCASPPASDATAELMGRLMVDVMIEALTGSPPSERAAFVTVGEQGRRGVCRELEHSVEGVELITVACSVWEAEPSGLEHVAFATEP